MTVIKPTIGGTIRDAGETPATTKEATKDPGKANSGGAGVVHSHDSVDRRPLTAPGIKPAGEIFDELPDAEFAVAKSAALAEMRELLAHASGDAKDVFGKMAAAAERVRRRRQTEIRIRINPRYVPEEKLEGHVERRVFRGRDGEPNIRMVFTPTDRREKTIYLDRGRMEGIPNGALVEVAPGKGNQEVIVTPKSTPIPNMVGTLDVDQKGRVVVRALSRLSAYSKIVVDERDAPKLRDLLMRRAGSDEATPVLIDLDHRTDPPTGVFHDFVTAERLQLLELDAGLSAGVAGTFDAAELAQAEKIAATGPLTEIPEGLIDQRAEIDISTDNPGSSTDYTSADPEQAATVIERDDRFIVKYKLAYSRPLVPDGSPIAEHGAENPQTYYGSGFDLPANPRAINMNKAVLLEGKARYAVTVECHIDKKTGQPILEDCGAYETVVENDWQGSYREAQIYYELQKDNLSSERRAELEAVAPELSDGVQEQLDLALRAHRLMRQAYIDDGGLLVGSRDDYTAEEIIHSFSTTANEVLGALNRMAGAPAVNRVHEATRLEQFVKFTVQVGVPWEPEKQKLSEYLRELPERVPAEMPELVEILGRQAIRFTDKAYYSSTESGHFGMGKVDYAHGSASNRLVSGLLNLANAVASTRVLHGEQGVEFPYSAEQAERFAQRQTEIQLAIDNAEQEQNAIRDALALESFVGGDLQARVVDVSTAGIALVTLEPRARVFIPMTHLKQALQARYDVEGPLAIRVGKRLFEVGQTLSIRVEDADPELHYTSVMLSDVPDDWSGWREP